jgi:hypothetical protein
MKARRQRCTARLSNGSRQCERWAINGSNVCATHGGRAPQVKKSAKERLAELIEPALAGLNKALESNDLTAIVKASQIVLDRTGFHPRSAVELFGKDGEPIQVESTLYVELLPTWLKQAIVVIGSGESIDPEIERTLQAYFEERFIKCDRLIGRA